VIAPVMFLLAALTVMTTSILSGELSYAKASGRLALAQAAENALSLGEFEFLWALRETVLNNLDAGRLAAAGIDASYAHRSGPNALTGSNLSYSSYEQINGTTAQSGSNDEALNLQTSTLGQEQRFSAIVSIELHGANAASALLAKRSRLLTLRVFSVPPFAIVDGVRDVATADDATGAAEGDPAGIPAAPGDVATPDPARPDNYRDTTIKVRHQCAGPDNGADPGTFGHQWGLGGAPGIDSACAPTPPPWATSPAPPPPPGNGDTFAARQWGNSNLNQSGWTR
jgi:hypothetical protein